MGTKKSQDNISCTIVNLNWSVGEETASEDSEATVDADSSDHESMKESEKEQGDEEDLCETDDEEEKNVTVEKREEINEGEQESSKLLEETIPVTKTKEPEEPESL